MDSNFIHHRRIKRGHEALTEAVTDMLRVYVNSRSNAAFSPIVCYTCSAVLARTAATTFRVNETTERCGSVYPTGLAETAKQHRSIKRKGGRN